MEKRVGVGPIAPDLSGAQSQSDDGAGARSARSSSEDGAPPASVPPLVIRGKSSRVSVDPATGEQVYLVEDGQGECVLVSGPNALPHAYAAITDWLNFTFPFEPSEERVGTFLRRLFEVLGPKFAPAVQRPIRLNNYDNCFELGEEMRCFFCYGGKHQRGTALVSLSGMGCSLITDWPQLVAWGRDELRGEVSRWDGAVDDFAGLHPVEEAIRLHDEGKFNAGGREPKMKQIGNWHRPDGSGRSVAIGRRKYGKRMLVYEKGMQLGCPGHPWVRWELSLGNKDRDIPWDVLLQPGHYVVGAYPKALSWVQEEMIRIRTLQKQTQIGYEAAVEHTRRQSGRTINLVVKVEGSLEKAFEKLRRDGYPKRVQHPAVEDPEGWIE